VQIPSDQGISFDQAPAMKAHEIAAATKAALLSGQYDFVRCNFPNPGAVPVLVMDLLETTHWQGYRTQISHCDTSQL
jgi:hypothetical protein